MNKTAKRIKYCNPIQIQVTRRVLPGGCAVLTPVAWIWGRYRKLNARAAAPMCSASHGGEAA